MALVGSTVLVFLILVLNFIGYLKFGSYSFFIFFSLYSEVLTDCNPRFRIRSSVGSETVFEVVSESRIVVVNL